MVALGSGQPLKGTVQPHRGGQIEAYAYSNHYYRDPEALKILDKIYECESSNRHLVKNPKSSAYSVCQIIDSTFLHIEETWGKDLERDSYKDNIAACEWLIHYEGTRHWKQSRECWSN